MRPGKTRNRLLAALAVLAAVLPAVTADPAVEALQLYRAGKCAQAEPLLREVLAKQPKNAAVRKLLAGCLVQLHRADEARLEYQQVLKTVPGDPEALRALQPQPAPARVAQVHPQAPAPEAAERAKAGAALDSAEKLIAAGRLEEAERILTGLAERSPDMIIPQQRLAEIHTRQKQYGQAASAYLALAEKHPDHPAFFLRAAQNFSWQQEYGPAADSYTQYLLQKPDDGAAQLELAEVLLWGDHAADAAEVYRAYIDRNPEDVDARLNLADALLWSKRFDEASAEFRHVLDRRPNDADAQYGVGQCYEHAAQLDLALKAYQKAAELNPQDEKVAQARARVAEALPRHLGFEHLEKQEYAPAAGAFLEYLKQHPDSTETMLQVARVYSWGKLYPDAVSFYRQYLERIPNDDTARRELAKIELATPDFPQAQSDYSKLAADGHASVEDYEGLVNAFVWDDKVEEAQPYAEKLAALSPDNAVALESRKLFRDQERQKMFDAAQKLTAAGRAQEALALYTSYATKFGTDREIDIAICRVYSWSKDYSTAEHGYLEYLQRYGEDTQARLELAGVQKWSGEYNAAESSYHAVLRRDPNNAEALLGLAQVSDYRGSDRFEVAKAYRSALVQDSANPAAGERLEELGPQVSPSLSYQQTSFTDSDSFARSVNRFEGAFPMRGGLKLMPMFGYDYFSQDLQVGGTACGSAEANALLKTLDNRICSASGTVHGAGAGGRIELAPSSHFSLSAEVYQTHFDTGRTSAQYRADAVFQGAGRALTLSFIDRDAVYDVNTVASLFDAVRGRHAYLSYQQPLSQRWRLWVMSGLSEYTSSASGASPSIAQRQFGARLDYAVTPEFTAGYYARGTTFSQASPLFFSPSYYGTYGFAYARRKPLSTALKLRLDGELGYGGINRFSDPSVSTLEIMLYPALEWKVRPDLNLLLGYRYGRGRSSAFGSPVYSTGSIDFRLEGSFMPPVNRVNPARLDLQ
jgi:tetratricopeptide (TPR) repeat protein